MWPEKNRARNRPADRIPEGGFLMALTAARGAHLLHSVIGQRLHGIRRWVLDLGGANDEFGHGITELRFESQTLTFRPGANEDYIVIEDGAVEPSSVDAKYFTEIDLWENPAWVRPAGKLLSIDLLTDGLEDVGVFFRFEAGGTVVIALTDTDLVVARDEKILERDPGVQAVLRETIR